VRVNTKTFRTSTFRLAALYLLFFTLSIWAVLGYIYYNTVSLLERQNEETILADVTGLTDQYRAQGVSGLLDAVNRRIAENPNILIMLADARGEPLGGNLRSPVISSLPDNSWINFAIGAGDNSAPIGHNAHGFNVQFPQGPQMIVGLDVEDMNQFRQIIRESLFWALGLAVLMGLGGGFWMSRNFLRRVDAITETSQSIMRGNLSGRMPVIGSGDELDRLAQALNEMLDQIEKLMNGMREVSSNVAHDLKTPLTRLRARAEAALRLKGKNEIHAALQQTLDDCDQLLSTFNALLSITKLESGQQRASLQVLDANDIIADVVDLYGPVAEEGQGILDMDSRPGLQVLAKRELLAQALINLIDNALKYGAGTGGAAHINVRGEKQGDEVVITVGDRGQGIAEKDRERVLQRFVRLDESRSKPGNGLGLSLVFSVVNFLGGKLVLADNRPGLKAELRLPLVRPLN
jgi:signal transduction histidine kinase